MKKINNYIIFLLVVLLTTSCKSQINTTNKTKIVVSSIKDTIVCDGEILSNYNLPFFNFDSKKSSDILGL